MARRRRRNFRGFLTSFIAISAAMLILNVYQGDEKKDIFSGNTPSNGEAVYVHFVDVGQGSATLIQQGSSAILIDAGEKDYGDYLVKYINSCGVNEIEYIVASHPHSDHIGGICDVLEEYPVGEIIMPELSEINTPTTRVYENLLNTVIDKDIDAVFIDGKKGYSFSLDKNIDVEVLGPVEQVKDLNDMSVICRVSAFDTEFMILGDAEKQELSSVYSNPLNDTVSLINSKNPFKSDVIAMGHHGSDTSLHKKFLAAVDADVAVISCGKDNSYGHPHEKTLDYIEKQKMTLYRTDTDGDIVFKCTDKGYERVEL